MGQALSLLYFPLQRGLLLSWRLQSHFTGAGLPGISIDYFL